VANISTPMSPVYRSSRPKNIYKETSKLNEQMDLIDIYRVFYSAAEQCTFFSVAHGTFYKIGHILGNKVGLKNVRKLK
jgi:hypothetical protein